MILELADIRIHPGQQAAFDEAIELQIFWATLEDHTIGFRQSPAFADWRAIVGPFFASPPVVEHFELVCKSD